MESWEAISALLAPGAQSDARKELAKVAGVAASTISSDGPRNDPIIVHGGGPRAHIYCIYGDDAVSGDGVEEDAFSKSPTEGDWRLSLPVPKEDLAWSQKKLGADSTRVTARAMGEELEEEKVAASVGGASVINIEEFMKS
jgi:hypothetical protein